jgi:phage-related protein
VAAALGVVDVALSAAGAPTYEYSYNRAMKPVRFAGSAREDLAAFPESARRAAGYELFMVQVGREPSAFKPMPDVGSGVYEIRVRDQAGAFRVIYVAKFDDAIYVLHAFQKKTPRTSRVDIEVAKRRYRLIGVKP